MNFGSFEIYRELHQKTDEKFPYAELLKAVGLVEIAIEEIKDKDLKLALSALQNLIAISNLKNTEDFKYLTMKKEEREAYLTKRKDYMDVFYLASKKG